MQKITPFLWFNDNAEEAVKFYTSVFKNGKIGTTARYDEAGAAVSGMPKGSVMTMEFEIEGQYFTALNGGPIFTFTPAVSFLIACSTTEEVDALWKQLSQGGTVLMELQEYPFSERYGWTKDRYGLSWQVMFMGDRPIPQKITPTLMFVGDVCGKAEEAIRRYVKVFRNANIGDVLRYGKGEEPDREGTLKHAAFALEGQKFAAMDSAHAHAFTFTEATSFVVHCETQEEVDAYWEKLSEGGDPKAQQCGWLKDQFGLSWQIVPTTLGAMLSDKDPEKSKRVMEAMLQMKKIDMQTLQKAFGQ